MTSTLASDLELLLRLRTKLVQLQPQRRERANQQVLIRQLDQIVKDRLAAAPEVSLDQLIEQANAMELGVDLSPLEALRFEQQLQFILHRRARAVALTQTYLDLADLFPGYSQIPLKDYSWSAWQHGFFDLVAGLRSPELTLNDQIKAAERCFGVECAPSIPHGLPGLSKQLVRRLVSQGTVDASAADRLVSSLSQLRTHAVTQTNRLAESLAQQRITVAEFNTHGELAHALLLDQLANASDPELDRYVLQYDGPGAPELLRRWLRRRGQNHQRRLLIAARTGIDPGDQVSVWSDWLDSRAHAEQQALGGIAAEIALQRSSYDLGIVLSCHQHLGDAISADWQPVIAALSATQSAPATAFPSGSVEAETTALPSAPIKTTEEGPVRDHQRATTEAMVVDETMEFLQAPVKPISDEDRIVEASSNWNVFLKPFLQESWLGLIGIGSLLVAWLFLSMWLWEKGQIHRLLVGALPLACITLGCAWLCRFFQRMETQRSPTKAIVLFAALTLFTVPFNFLIGASLLKAGGVGGIAAGLALAALYVFALTRLCPALAKPIGHDPQGFLITLGLLIYLPVVVDRFWGSQLLLSLDLFLLLGYEAYARSLGTAKQPTKTLCWLLGITLLCAIAVVQIYFSVLPGKDALGILAQLVALTMARHAAGRGTTLAYSGGLSVFGLALAASQPIALCLALALAIWLWWQHQKDSASEWAREIFALHLIASAVAICYALGLVWYWAAYIVLLPMAVLQGLEARCVKEVRLLSYAPMAALPVVWMLAMFKPGAVHVALAAILACFALYRLQRWYYPRLWVATIGLAAIVLFACSVPILGFRHDIMALYAGLIALAWGVISPRFDSDFVRAHGATAFYLLALLGILTATAAYGLSVVSYVPGAAVGEVLVAAALLLVAKRTRSMPPVWLALALISWVLFSVRAHYGLHSESGLGAASLALGLMLLSRLVEVRAIWANKKPQQFFGQPFPVCTESYLRTPLRWAGALLAAVALFKSTMAFAILTHDPRPAIVLLLVAISFSCLAQFARRRLFAWAAIAALLLSLTAAMGSLPSLWWPHASFVALFALAELQGIIPWDKLAGPAKQLFVGLSYLSVPLGVCAYAFLLVLSKSPWVIFSYGALALLFNHRYLVMGQHRWFVHLVLLHLVVLTVPLGLELGQHSILFYISVPALLFFLGAYPFELAKEEIRRWYAIQVQYWIRLIAVVFAVLIIMGFPDLLTREIATVTVGLVLIHAGNRWWKHSLPLLLKALLWVSLSLVWVDNLALAGYLGLLFFTLTEWAFMRLPQSSRWQAIEGQLPKTLVYEVVHIMIWLCIGLQFYVFVSSYGEVASLASLYLLIPFCVYLSRLQRIPYLSYLGQVLFVYANTLVLMQWQSWFQSYAIGRLQILSLACLISIIVFLLIGRWLAPVMDRSNGLKTAAL